MRPEYAVWLAEKRASAKARGGKPLRNLPGAGTEFSLPRSRGRAKGEIVNPVTGEVVSGCLTIAKLADSLKLRPVEVTDILEELGCVQRVLRWHNVPMICDPRGFLVKPSYYHAPEVTRHGLEAGLAVPLVMVRNGVEMCLVLITPEGQGAVRERLATKAGKPATLSKADARRGEVGRLMAAGRSQAEIVRETGIPKQTVSRICAGLKEEAQAEK